MASLATLEELKSVQTDLDQVKTQHADGYKAVADILRKHRKVGYKNICKMLLDEATPEKLKGLE